VLDGRASWDAVSDALVDEREFLRGFVAEQAVQTNEVQRCWALLPCFLEAARRSGADTLDLIELGPSAGLNLVWDRDAYGYEEGAWGPAGAPLELRGEERRAVPGAGSEGPLAFVSNPHDGMNVQLWPGGEAVKVADADFHGAWLEWLA
jgi:hypothetical protein